MTLDAAARDALVLVSAPGGAGKTRLLAEWFAPKAGSVAWAALDESDNDDRRFWSTVLSALESCPAVPVDNPLRQIPLPVEPSRDAAFLGALAVALDALPAPVWLVLDDVHELVAAGPRHGLEFLARERPAHVRLALAGRNDPPLSIARLRLLGRLCEVRAADLAFSLDEAREMLAAADIALRPDQVGLLVEQTEGWAAGLRLAAMSLRPVDDRDRFLADLAGNSRALADYLVDEILSRLPADVVDLLTAVSVCERVAAELAVALGTRSDAAEVLDALERETFLVESSGTGRIWYRLPALLRAHLLADLERRHPDRAMRLHRVAAEWFAGRDDPVAAVEHARRAGAADRVDALLRAHGVTLVAAGELTTLASALAWLETTSRAGGSWPALLAALVAAERGEVARARARVAGATASWPADPEPDLVALHELVRARLAAVGLTRPDPATTPAEGGRGEGTELGALAGVEQAMLLLFSGDRPGARALATAAVEDARRLGRGYLTARTLTTLAVLDAVEGDHRALATRTDEADALLRDAGLGSTAGAALCVALRAYDALLRADATSCLDLLGDVPDDWPAPAAALDFRPAERAAPGDRAQAEMGGMRAAWMAMRGAATHDLGSVAEGLRELTAARGLADLSDTITEVAALVALLEHRAATGAGKAALAGSVSGWAAKAIDGAGEVLLLQATDHAAVGDLRGASALLRPLLTDSAPVLLPWTRVEAHLVMAHLALRDGRPVQARDELRGALALADTIGVLRPLVLAAAPVAELLARHLGSFGPLDVVAGRALDVRRTLAGAPAAALTDRERTVLQRLSTSRSLDEIATELEVSTSTVKSHVRAIYTKLGVSSRREAVSRARVSAQRRQS